MIYFNNRNGSLVWLVGFFADWSPLLPYVADGTAHYAEKVGDTQQLFNAKASLIGPAVRVFANGPGDLGSIPGRVIPKTLKMVLDTTLLNTQHYKVRFKGKVEQSWEWSSALPYTLV